jgi:hypothetical protein
MVGAAAQYGHLAVVQEYWPTGSHDEYRQRQLAVVKYLIPPGTKPRRGVLDATALCSSKEIADYVLSTQDNPDWCGLLLSAAEGDRVSAAEYPLRAHTYSSEEIRDAIQWAPPRPDIRAWLVCYAGA